MDKPISSLMLQTLPRLTALIGGEGIHARQAEFEKLGTVGLWQVERDLCLIDRYVPPSQMAKAYGSLLRRPGELVPALYEIRVGAMLAPFVAGLELAPARGDVAFLVDKDRVFVEVTTAQDDFPPEEVYRADPPRFTSRATVEPSFYSSPGVDDPVPFSTALRQRIWGESRQLPAAQMTVVVVGCPGGRSLDMECALFGDEVYRLRGGKGLRESVPNGVFAVPDEAGGMSRLSAVVWMKLVRHFGDTRVYGRLFTNPRAAVPLSWAAIDLLRRVFDRRKTLFDELTRMRRVLIEKYAPERIILFGSLAEELGNGWDRVHHGSDIDLAIVKSTGVRFMDRVREVMDLVQPQVGVNALVYTPEEIERAQREGNFFVRDEILKKGRVIFP